jgi:hypothetical protein
MEALPFHLQQMDRLSPKLNLPVERIEIGLFAPYPMETPDYF